MTMPDGTTGAIDAATFAKEAGRYGGSRSSVGLL